jgi:hypothetical protein
MLTMVFTGFHHGCHFEKSRHGDVLCGPTNVEQVALKLCCGDWHMIPGSCIIINHQKDRMWYPLVNIQKPIEHGDL